MPDVKPKRKSGGARAVEKKNQQRQAQRPEGYAEREAIAARRVLRRAGKGLEGAARSLARAVAVQDFAMERALVDPGLPLEQRREQAIRASAALAKAADPKKQLDEMGAELREAHAIIAGLQERDGHAAQEPSPGPGGPQAPHH